MQFLHELGIEKHQSGNSTGSVFIPGKGRELISSSPVDGTVIGSVTEADESTYETIIAQAQSAFLQWRNWPAPRRGEIVRQIGDALRAQKDQLGRLVSYEMGKSLQEGWGEVQEMIDICDFAVGLSRQLYGLTMHSERPTHRMYEQWHPLGIVGIISAFNFPVAVWSWNSALAWVCGNARKDPTVAEPQGPGKPDLTGPAASPIRAPSRGLRAPCLLARAPSGGLSAGRPVPRRVGSLSTSLGDRK